MAEELAKKRKSEELEAVKQARLDDRNGIGVSPPPSFPPVHPKGYHASRKGERDDMQDSHVILDQLTPLLQHAELVKSASYYAVFDGHSGAQAALFCAKHLHTNLIERFPSAKDIKQNLKRCLTDAYKKTDDDFLAEARRVKPPLKDGTTATAVLILDNVAYVSNIGDSRAILCRRAAEERCLALTLTVDHSPTKFEERQRIQRAGGSVKDGRVMGQLEVSRSIGDGQYKNHGVTCVPDVKSCTLTPNDKYLLIACDGLWKTFSNAQVISFIEEAAAETTTKTFAATCVDAEKSHSDHVFEAICGKLAAEAVRRGSGDNVTVVLVRLNGYLMEN